MCGQIHLASVRVESLPDIWAAFERNGFFVQPNESGNEFGGPSVHLHRGNQVLIIGIHHYEDPKETILSLAHPPYSLRFWRWGADIRLFNDVEAILDEFHIVDEFDRAC